MKKLNYALLFIILPAFLFAQTHCYENVRFSPFTYINDVVMDEGNAIFYEGGGMGRCKSAFVQSSTDTETNWITSPSVASIYYVSQTTELWKSDEYIAAIGIFQEVDDGSSPNDGFFFSLIDLQTGNEAFSLLLNVENLGNLYDCSFFNNYYTNRPHLVQVSENTYWMSAYCGHLILIDPSLPEGFSLIENIGSNITQMRPLTDSLIAVSTSDDVYIYNIHTQQHLGSPIYTFQDFNTNVLMDSNTEGALFIIENQQLIKIYPEQDIITSLSDDYTYYLLKTDGADFLLLGQNDNHNAILRYDEDSLSSVYTTAHTLRNINGIRPLGEQYLYWGSESYQSIGASYSNPFISLQPKAEAVCDYERDIALISLEALDTSINVLLNEQLLFYTISTSIHLRATIVNKGAAIQSFSLVSRASDSFNCLEGGRFSKKYHGYFATGDTIVLDSIFFYKSTHYSYQGDDIEVEANIDFTNCLSIGTPDSKQDIFIDDNSSCINLQTSVQVIITDTEDIAQKPNESILLFPNPASGEFSIKAAGGHTFSHISIYDLSGRQWQSYAVDKQYEYSLNSHDIPRGIYVIKIILTNGQYVTKRVIFE